jgi:diacylglycerol kinase family enzyme
VRLLFIVNPKSGRGRALALADEFSTALAPLGHEIERAPVGDPAGFAQLDSYNVCVVFGGDGTVHNLLPALIGSPAALYHVPTGTENLFARQFGMDRRPATLCNALARGESVITDVGHANGRPFAIMCSAGPDAGVVRRLAARRKGAIRHSSYVSPIIAELFSPSLGPICIDADGREVVQRRRGAVIVANSRMYALGLNPARQAEMTDGLLDVVFLPASSSLSLAWWACRTVFASPLRSRDAFSIRAADITIRAESRTPYQLDGDDAGLAGDVAGSLRIQVRPRCLRVLTPV